MLTLLLCLFLHEPNFDTIHWRDGRVENARVHKIHDGSVEFTLPGQNLWQVKSKFLIEKIHLVDDSTLVFEALKPVSGELELRNVVVTTDPHAGEGLELCKEIFGGNPFSANKKKMIHNVKRKAAKNGCSLVVLKTSRDDDYGGILWQIVGYRIPETKR